MGVEVKFQNVIKKSKVCIFRLFEIEKERYSWWKQQRFAAKVVTMGKDVAKKRCKTVRPNPNEIEWKVTIDH